MNKTLNDETNKFRLGVCGAEYGIPFDLGRCRGPFMAMAREDRRLEIIEAPKDNPNWPWMLDCDAIYVQNPVWDVHTSIIATAKMAGIPVWADWGDDVFNTQIDNPARQNFSDKEAILENVKWIAHYADICTVITDTCKESFVKEMGESVRARLLVIGEACRWARQNRPRQKVISWRGASSHGKDVVEVAPQLAEVVADPKFADWQFVLFGDPHWLLIDELARAAGEDANAVKEHQGKRIKVSPWWPTPFHMFEAWKSFAPYLHITPLEDNLFNRAKPPNAWLEASAVGAATIAPEFLTEWDNCPGLIRYAGGVIQHSGKQNLATVLRREMARFDGGKLHPEALVSQAAVFGDGEQPPMGTLDAVNQRRWACVRKLAQIGQNPGVENQEPELAVVN